MDDALRKTWLMTEQDQRISDAVDREYARLRNFIRSRVVDPGETEDILQDVFSELVEAYRTMKPVEQVTAWLFKVARNRMIDLFRRRKRDAVRNEQPSPADDAETLQLEEMLPSPDAGPEETFMRNVLVEELDAALDELPEEQREVFVAHELMGQSFKEIATETGVGVNTLLSRKHYAVLHLRERLQDIYGEFLKL
jgi:RNA polymerase sigma factor (sigma-70 family)